MSGSIWYRDLEILVIGTIVYERERIEVPNMFLFLKKKREKNHFKQVNTVHS